jgi:hypothetical protein
MEVLEATPMVTRFLFENSTNAASVEQLRDEGNIEMIVVCDPCDDSWNTYVPF